MIVRHEEKGGFCYWGKGGWARENGGLEERGRENGVWEDFSRMVIDGPFPQSFIFLLPELDLHRESAAEQDCRFVYVMMLVA